ncbi:MAG: PEGA domain-containing protein [Methanoregula sp.]|uniref:PEGA domain-containing protein n=1 Tax=Methanoregula sp. TaxID=2052170 RepID=UPI0025D3E998|nr:PEGA domain-containing protein [Methanoregula sp.]MCK9631098.1 PEGA domain-containing protein [Methanoregula sp.]
MRKPCALLIILVLCVFCSAIAVPVAADGDTPGTNVTMEPTVTLKPVTAPTTEATTVPTTVKTTEPTTIPTTTVTTVVTTEPTTRVTTEPTITLVTIPVTEPGGGKGYIDTHCNVDGASVYFDGSYQCMIAQGICTVGVSPTGTPVSSITVSKSGYTTWSGSPAHMPSDGEHVEVYSTINPLSTPPTTVPPVQTGTIYAQSSPAGAAIYLNGNFYGYSPVTIPNLAPGSYSMKASLSGYTPDTQVLSVYAGQTATYYPVLQPSPPAPRSTGTVSVSSNPSGALIYVDGSYQGKTPMTVTLYPGSHMFRLSLAGYTDYTSTLYVNANSNQNLNADLTPAVYGTAQVTSLPGASVFIDSNSQGKIPSSGTLTIHNVANGNRLFKVTAPGYNDWLNTVYIQPNVVTPINAVLTQIGTNPTPVPATGGIEIVSTPTGAEIYVDNLFKGYTPSTLTGIAAGEHQVLLKYTGYIDYTQAVTVNAGQTTPLAINMQSAPTPTPASAPSLAIFIGGIVMAAGIGAVLRRRS